MSEFEKRMMKLEKKQLVITLSTILSRYNKEQIEDFVSGMENHEYRKYLRKCNLISNVISFFLVLLIILFFQWIVGVYH